MRTSILQDTLRRVVLTALVAAVAPLQISAQARSLGQPAARFPEDFGAIQTVRELADGRVLVADPLGKALYAVNMDAGTRTVVGSEGQGPEEYLQPDAVWPLPGDSTLLIDLGNGRLVALGPDFSFGPTMPIGLSEPRPGTPLVLALPQGVDARGRLYARQMGGGLGRQPPDSAAILRIDRASRSGEPVASFKLQDMTQTTSGGPNNRSVMISPIPLSPEDAWGVAADGSIALARAGDYHVDWISPDGSVTSGPPVPYEALRIGTPEKEEYVAEQGRSGGGVAVSVAINNGQVSMSFSRGTGAGRPREIDNYQWPDRKPPFYQGRLPVDGSNRVWVRRHVEAGGPSTYDVFDRQGVRVGTITLDSGKRIVGFGAGWVYVVAYDEFDLNYLERYRMPAL